jgi:hypothetical protein
MGRLLMRHSRVFPFPLAGEGAGRSEAGEGYGAACARPEMFSHAAKPPHPNPLPRGERGQVAPGRWPLFHSWRTARLTHS